MNRFFFRKGGERSLRSSRYSRLWDWKNMLRWGGRTVILGGSLVTLGTVGTAAAVVYVINRPRVRNWTDDFHLNPEIFRMPYRNVDVTTEDGITLRGWWIPATVQGRDSNRIVILLHPYNNHKSNLLGVASGLWGRGYSVFMFDFRSFCKEKTKQSVGYFEQKDASAALKHVLQHYAHLDSPDHTQIVLMGASMGGVVAMLSSPQYKKYIQAIVCDCSFYSLREIIGYRLEKWSIFPVALVAPCLYVVSLMNEFLYGYSLDSVSPINVISKEDFNIPMLFVHSSNDSVVPMKHSEHMYEKCHSTRKDLWIVDGIDHCGGFFAQPKIFVDKIANWVDNVLEEERDHALSELRQQQQQEYNDQDNNSNNSNSSGNDRGGGKGKGLKFKQGSSSSNNQNGDFRRFTYKLFSDYGSLREAKKASTSTSTSSSSTPSTSSSTPIPTPTSSSSPLQDDLSTAQPLLDK